MAKEDQEKDIEVEYSFDRLSGEKMSQVYRALVPERVWILGMGNNRLKQGEKNNEDSSNICTSIIGEAKGRKDDR